MPIVLTGKSGPPLTTPPRDLTDHIAKAWPPESWADVTVLVGVSGGPDSLALLRALAILKQGGEGRLVVAHFDHRLRGSESTEDSRFVVSLAQRLSLPCDVGYPGGGRLPGAEESARNERYRFFSSVAQNWGARHVAVGHTADDQAETILHRILRGTGISGLAGIPPVRRLNSATTLVRPLLAIRRSDVLRFLQELGQDYRTDSSNSNRCYTRNRLRQLLPELEKDFNPKATEALLRLGTQAAEAADVLAALVEELFDRSVQAHPRGEIAVSVRPLANEKPYLLKELAMRLWRKQGWPRRAMAETHWAALAQLMSGSVPPVGAAMVLPGAIEARRIDDTLILRPVDRRGSPPAPAQRDPLP